MVESVERFSNKKWQRDKCLQKVGELLGKVDAAQAAYASSRSLVAANGDWDGAEFKLSMAALTAWHEAHAEGGILRVFL